MIRVHVVRERSIKSVVVEGKKFLPISLIRVIIPVGALISIRDTRMIPEILKTENNREKQTKRCCF